MSQPTEDLYDRIVALGIEIDNHESDLYVPDTPAVRQVIEEYRAEGGIVSTDGFVSRIDGKRWLDLPFHYAPWWAERIPAPASSPAP